MRFTNLLFLTFLIHYFYYLSTEVEKDDVTVEFVDFDEIVDICIIND